MKISVIIPTYKPREYLWECLDSLTSQTLSKDDYEIIVVLNGCDEPYKSQIQSYIDSKEGFRINLIQTDTPGVSNARNIGLDNSKGEYISFIDDDDYVSSSYLEELYQHAAPNVISVCFPYAFNDGVPYVQLQYSLTDEFLKRSAKGKTSYLKVKKLFSGPCMKLIHKDIIGDRRFDCRLKNGEDSLFMFSISDRMKWVSFTSQQAVYYRRFRVNSATTRKLSWGYVLKNCWMRFLLYSKFFFGDPKHYSFYRYCCGMLGICHILLNRLLKGEI
jgi:glycosyltransferase involved in cell wall biosynthesis